jgi:predicted unusual protein kinase regulating ubiquinone biosynthesis (AarF/ABC1/UbiB family)
VNALTFEDVRGIKVADHSGLADAVVDPADMVARLFCAYAKPILRRLT